MILSAKVVTHDGCAADGIANEHCNKDKAHIHEDTVGCHAILPSIAKQLDTLRRTVLR